MPRVARTADVAWEGNLARGAGTLAVESGAFDGIPFTLASRVAAPEGRTNPEELLAAAHAGCFTMSLAGVLTQRGTPPERLDVTATVVIDEVEGKGHQIVLSELSGTATVAGVSAEELADAARVADEECPFSTLVRGTAEVRVDVRPA
jgi:osmotically inducible protein OsmC